MAFYTTGLVTAQLHCFTGGSKIVFILRPLHCLKIKTPKKQQQRSHGENVNKQTKSLLAASQFIVNIYYLLF